MPPRIVFTTRARSTVMRTSFETVAIGGTGTFSTGRPCKPAGPSNATRSYRDAVGPAAGSAAMPNAVERNAASRPDQIRET